MFLPRALANIVDKVARQTVGKDWNLYAALLDHWQEIVGVEYAQVTAPVKMTFPHQPNERRPCNGTLTVRLPKGLAMEFTFKTEQVRQRINGYFGYDAVAKITFQPVFGAGPAPAPPARLADPTALEDIRNTAKDIEDDDLRGALEAFGAAVLSYSNRDDPVK
jgi:hypothetical protein